MRQVPKYSESLNNFWGIFSLVLNAEVAQGILLVLFVFIFIGDQRALGLGADKHAQLMYYGLAIAIIRFGGIFSNIIFAWLSDSLGISRLLFFSCLSLVLFAFLGGAGLFFHSLYLFFFSVCLFGLTYALRPLVLSFIGAEAKSQRKLMPMAFLQGTIALGAMLGPLFATHISGLSYDKIYGIAGGFALLSMCFLPKKTKVSSPLPLRQLSASLIHVLKNPAISYGLTLLLIDQLAWSSFYDFIPVTLKIQWHVSNARVGDFVGLISVVLILSSWLLMPFLKKFFQGYSIMRRSVLMMTLGLLTITLFGQNHLWAIPLGMTPLAAGDVIFYAFLITYMSNHLSEHNQGQLMGLNYCIVGLSWGVTSLLGGYLSRFGTHYVYIFASACAFLLLIMVMLDEKMGGYLYA